MALRSPSSTPLLDPASRDSPPADSPPPASEGGSINNGRKAEVGRKKKEGVDRLLAKLDKVGVEIDDKIASIIDDGIARIKAEAVREIYKPKKDLILVLNTIACMVVGFMMGAKWYKHALIAANSKDKKRSP